MELKKQKKLAEEEATIERCPFVGRNYHNRKQWRSWKPENRMHKHRSFSDALVEDELPQTHLPPFYSTKLKKKKKTMTRGPVREHETGSDLLK